MKTLSKPSAKRKYGTTSVVNAEISIFEKNIVPQAAKKDAKIIIIPMTETVNLLSTSIMCKNINTEITVIMITHLYLIS